MPQQPPLTSRLARSDCVGRRKRSLGRVASVHAESGYGSAVLYLSTLVKRLHDNIALLELVHVSLTLAAVKF